MKLSLICFIILFLMHIFDLSGIIFNGEKTSDYFIFQTKYVFDTETAFKSLNIVLLFTFSLILGSIFGTKKYKIGDYKLYSTKETNNFHLSGFVVLIFIVSAGLVIFIFSYAIFSGQIGYVGFTKFRANNSFFFELRFIPLTIAMWILVNKEFHNKSIVLLANIFLFSYVTLVIMTGTRSLILEFFPLFYLKFHHSSNLKFSFLLIAAIAIFIPLINYMIYLRLDLNDFNMYADNFYKFEYAKLLNNYFGAVIQSDVKFLDFLNSLNMKLIPSVFRESLNIQNISSIDGIDQAISSKLGPTGGGSSGLAEVYVFFGFAGLFIFFLFGFHFSVLSRNLQNQKFVSIYQIGSLLLFITFILMFRNGFVSMLKIYIQYFIGFYIINLASRIRFVKPKLI